MATTQAPELDHVDRFLEKVRDELPQLDLAVEGIVDRIAGISRRLQRMLDETLAEFGLTNGEWKVLGHLRQAGAPYRRCPGERAHRAEPSGGAGTSRLDRLAS